MLAITIHFGLQHNVISGNCLQQNVRCVLINARFSLYCPEFLCGENASFVSIYLCSLSAKMEIMENGFLGERSQDASIGSYH